MHVKIVMRNPAGILAPSDPLAAAVARLAPHPERVLVVVDGGRVVGVVTEAGARAVGPSTLPALARYEWPALLARLTVRDAMSPHPVVVAPEATVPDVARVLVAAGQRTAVVMDGGDVVGIVDARDLVRSLVEDVQTTPSAFGCILVALGLPTETHGARGLRMPLDIALAIARRHGARVTLVHVLPWLAARVAAGLSAGAHADLERGRLAAARAALWPLVPREAARAVRLDIRTGDVVAGIVAAAEEAAAELIVMGGQPGSRLVRATARRAPCPVLAA